MYPFHGTWLNELTHKTADSKPQITTNRIVQEWLKHCNIRLELTLQIAILGDFKSHNQSINNTIIILAKMLIYNL
jgi:hypothetical protein